MRIEHVSVMECFLATFENKTIRNTLMLLNEHCVTKLRKNINF